MNRQFNWVKKIVNEIIKQAIFEIKIKRNKIDNCDNVHQSKKSIEQKLYDSSPIFIVSTGRSGTKFLAELLKIACNIETYHEPSPTLMSISRDMFNEELSAKQQQIVFKAARHESMIKHILANVRYVESNQTLVSLIDGILLTIPNAKILCLTRNPIKFANSAYKKGWFENDTIWENNRIVKNKNRDSIINILNYWVVVNTLLVDKTKNYPNNCKLFMLENIVSDDNVVKELMAFLDIKNYNHNKILKKTKIKVNTNKFNSWDHEGINKKENDIDFDGLENKYNEYLSVEILPLAKTLGYEI